MSSPTTEFPDNARVLPRQNQTFNQERGMLNLQERIQHLTCVRQLSQNTEQFFLFRFISSRQFQRLNKKIKPILDIHRFLFRLDRPHEKK